MVNDDLIERGAVGTEEWSRVPSERDLIPLGKRRERKGENFVDQIDHSTEVVVLTHGDADGLTSAALIRFLARQAVVQPVSYNGAYRFKDALSDLISTKRHNIRLVILDFNPDDEATTEVEQIETLANDRGFEIEWYDHHQWDDEIRAQFEEAGATVHVDTDECTASLLLFEMPDVYDGHHEELVEVTKDRDLWINEDPRGEDLNTFAWISEDPYEYIGTVLEHGPDLPQMAQERVDTRQEVQEEVNRLADRRAETDRFGGYDIAYTYQSGGVNSEIGNALCENQGADIAIVMTPDGGGSIYSDSSGEVFDQCHEIAELMGGGGHPTAAGFGLDFESFREQAEYWATEGESHKSEVLANAHIIIEREVEA